jgi:hypothetical protein
MPRVVCNEKSEDSNYIIFLCPKSIQCWQLIGLWDKIHASIDPGNTTTTNLFLILNLDSHQQDIFSVMLWSIWKRRNNQEWEQIAEISQNVCD